MSFAKETEPPLKLLMKIIIVEFDFVSGISYDEPPQKVNSGGPMRVKLVFTMLVVSLLMTACGGSAGSDSPRAVLEQTLKMMDDLSNALEKADNADQVAAALNQYTKEIEKIGPSMKALREKYPELANNEGKFPEELKDFEEKFNAMGMKMMGAMMGKVMQYASDPKVTAAQQKMMEASQKMMQ